MHRALLLRVHRASPAMHRASPLSLGHAPGLRQPLGRAHSTAGSVRAPGGALQAVRHTPLHLDIEQACRCLAPTAQERALQEETIQKVRT